jgi:hypothetical protein
MDGTKRPSAYLFANEVLINVTLINPIILTASITRSRIEGLLQPLLAIHWLLVSLTQLP